MKSKRSAFTLVELLIVVAIISILSLIAVPNFLEAQTRAKVSRIHADMRSLASAIETYMIDHNSYPPNGVLVATGAIQNPQNNGQGAPAHKFIHESITTPIAYMTSIPNDPFVEGSAVRPEWQAFWPRHFFTNFDWFTEITQPAPPPVIARKMEKYGTWVLAAAGPDRDRLDLNRDMFYDPTNGTVSDGDVVRSPKVITRY